MQIKISEVDTEMAKTLKVGDISLVSNKSGKTTAMVFKKQWGDMLPFNIQTK